MIFRCQQLEEKISSLQAQLDRLPAGKLICSRNGNFFKWFHSDGHKKTYLPKAQKPFAQQLALKKYLSQQMEDLRREKKAIDTYLQHRPDDKRCADQLLSEGSGYAELLSPFFKPESREFSDWMTTPYERCEKFPETLVHKTTSGIMVRSKSEAMIAAVLHANKIPFRYECALQLGETTIFPDFTIRHPKTGRFFYWEHFGLMDQVSYCRSTFSKLDFYAAHKIIPSIQLLATFETREAPLSYETVEKMVEHYFL